MKPLTTIFKALSDENRFRILEMLLSGDLCVGALAHRLGISKPAVSQHLRLLSEAGLVTGERRGYWIHYTVNRLLLEKVAEGLAELSRAGQDRGSVCLIRLPEAARMSGERRMKEMCRECCQKPEKLRGKPSECSREQIEECHGEAKGHPCIEGTEEEEEG